MELNCYSFYDTKSKIYDTPFHAESDLQAKRHFYMVAQKNGTVIGTFTEKFELRRVGTFLTDDGEYCIDRFIEKTILEGKELYKEFAEKPIELE